MSRLHWVCPCSQRVCFPCLHCLGSRLLCRELSEARPGLYALPRSKPLRFRYSGSPQRLRLGWTCVLSPSQVRAAQVTRCLASAVAATYCLPCPCRLVFWVYNWRTFSGGYHCPESQEVLVSYKACLQFGRQCLFGAAIAPFWLWLPVTRGGWSAAGYLCSVFCSVSGPDGVLG